MESQEAHCVRPKLTSIISSAKPPTPNISKDEAKALKTLAKDDKIMILPADKGRATVVMDQEEYEGKVKAMLSDEKTYLKLNKDPTASYKRKLVKLITQLRKSGKISESQKRYLYPTSEITPRLYCTPKIHKPGNPLRPIVDYTGSIAYNVSRSLADILAPLVGKTKHHVNNSKDMVNELKDLHLQEDETMVSFDVVSLFTNTPLDQAIKVIRDRLVADTDLKSRTLLSADDIMSLLEFVLSTTYFVFGGQVYQQKFGTAMGSPVSPIVANLYMEHLEQTAIASAPTQCKPRLWKRYVDDVLAVILKGYTLLLNDHLNTIDSTGNIKFTNEEMEDNKIPFLDVNIVRKEDGTVKTIVYRKKTHTNQYLNFSSHHPTVHKLGVIRTLLDRAETVVTETEDRSEEITSVQDALTICGYPQWSFREIKQQIAAKKDPENTLGKSKKKPASDNKSKGQIVIPYIKGLSERISRVLRPHNIRTTYKPYRTIRNILVHPKDKLQRDATSGCVYQIGCANCTSVYIGETGRPFGVRLEEHKKDVEAHCNKGVNTRATRLSTAGDLHKSAITDHMVDNNHVPDWEGAKLLDKDGHLLDRQIRESIQIRKNKNNMNRDEGSYKLSHVYDTLLQPRPPERSKARAPKT